MRKAVQLYQRDGLAPVLEQVFSRLRSAGLRRRYGYPAGFLIRSGTDWLTGPYAQVGENLRIGKRCRIETINEHNGYSYQPKLIFGNNVSLNDDIHIGCVESVIVGNDVLMASKIYISDHNHGNYNGIGQDSALSAPGDRLLGHAPIVIEDQVWLGELVTVLPGVTIGHGSIIGANSVVSRDIPPLTIAVGAPARPIKQFDQTTGLWHRLN